MITITTNLNANSASRNPAKLLGSTDAYETVAGTAGVYGIEFATNPSVDDFFTINIAGLVLQFVGKATPDTSGYQWKVWNDNTTFLQMIADFEENYYLTKYFNITHSYGLGTVTFTEKIPGESSLLDEYTVNGNINITIGVAVHQAFATAYKNVIEFHKQADPTAVPADDLKATFEVVPDADEDFVFEDLSPCLKALVSSDPPQLGDAVQVVCSNMATWYNCKLWEEFGSPVLAYHMIRIGSANAYKRAFHGGVLQQLFEHTDHDYAAKYLTATYNRFLTYLPQDHYISEYQPIALYFFVKSGVTTLHHKVTIYYTDGTTSSATIATNSVTGDAIHRVWAGFRQNSLETVQPSKTPWKVKFWLESQTTRISEERTFLVRQSPVPGTNFLYFENPLGAWDPLWIEGYEILSADTISRNDKLLYPPSSHYKGDYINAPIERFRKLTARTGFLTKAGAQWLQQILSTEGILFYNQELDILEPLIIKSKDLPVWEEGRNLMVFELEFTFARTE